MGYLSQLNHAQKEAVLHKDGPLLVIAGAGAGKTRTLTYRILHLIKNGVLPGNILAVTFTNKAAQEMRERIKKLSLTPFSPITPFTPFFSHETPFIGTFHSLGVRMLREKGGMVGIPKSFTIKDKEGALSLIKEAVREIGCDKKKFEPLKIQAIISREKGELRTPALYVSEKGESFAVDTIASIWERYEKLLQKERSLDFDDLISKPVALLDAHKEAREYFRNKWRYIHIDEYQDTNKAQYVLSRLLAEPKNNICVVGDIDQNVYGWRGSSIRNILNFEKDFPDTRTVLLEENYRSSGRILCAANEIIKKNRLRIEKNLFTKNGDGEKISLIVSPNEKIEAFRVANIAKTLIKDGVLPKDIATLYRANFQSRALEEAFLSQGVPYQVIGTRFFERKEVRDIIAFLNAAMNPESLGDIKRVINVPPRGIGKVTIAQVFSGMQESLPISARARVQDFYNLLDKIRNVTKELPPSKIVRYVLTETGMHKALKEDGEEGVERLLNIEELANLAERYDARTKETALSSFMEDVALASDQDALKEEKNGVRLMTVHAAKGLEFPYVCVTGLEQGLFPHESFEWGGKDALAAEERAEEERRLFYVAVTRAAKKLFLSYAETRMVFGSRGEAEPSVFLRDIPEDLMEYEDLSDEDGAGEVIEI